MIGTIFHFFQSNKKRAVIIAILWTVLILFACFIQGSELPKVSLPLIDKWVHFIIFAGFSFLWYCTLKHLTIKNSVLIILLSIGVGFLVELIQGSNLIKNRSYELNDVIADGIGGIIGVIIFTLLATKYSSIKN